jgi:DNA-binding MarR family transcriptional regulator
MQAPSTDATDDVAALLRGLQAFRAAHKKGTGSRLPIYSDVFLVFLRSQPESRSGMKRLRDQFMLGVSTTHRTCLALQRAGLVDIEASNEDRRQTLVSLTHRGSDLVDRAVKQMRVAPR